MSEKQVSFITVKIFVVTNPSLNMSAAAFRKKIDTHQFRKKS
jgi:hypothetical protein